MTVEAAVTRKALAEACEHLRDARSDDALPLVRPAYVASPRSTEEAAALLRVAAAHSLTVLIQGGRSRLIWGARVSKCDLVLDTRLMSGVVEHAAGDLVARVRAGTPMGEVADVLAKAGQEIALDVPRTATVGGVVASGLAGPRRLRYGTPRDLVIGITVVRADGTPAKSGGKVVKNVAGYDLGKLFAGSFGTLGLITEVTFRLHPLPAARSYVTAPFGLAFTTGTSAKAAAAVAAAANSPLTASAVQLSRDARSDQIRVGVLLEGSAEGVAARAAGMAELLGPSSAVTAGPPGWWPWTPSAGHGETLIQVSCWVSALGPALDAIENAAIAAGVSPEVSGPAGAGVLYLRVPTWNNNGGYEPGRKAAADFVVALREKLAGPRGGVTVLDAPAAVRGALGSSGGMAGVVPGAALMRAVKDQFDPGHRLAPGRFPQMGA